MKQANTIGVSFIWAIDISVIPVSHSCWSHELPASVPHPHDPDASLTTATSGYWCKWSKNINAPFHCPTKVHHHDRSAFHSLDKRRWSCGFCLRDANSYANRIKRRPSLISLDACWSFFAKDYFYFWSRLSLFYLMNDRPFLFLSGMKMIILSVSSPMPRTVDGPMVLSGLRQHMLEDLACVRGISFLLWPQRYKRLPSMYHLYNANTYHATCHKCSKKVHYQSVCWSQATVSTVDSGEPEESGDIFLGAVHSHSKPDNSPRCSSR